MLTRWRVLREAVAAFGSTPIAAAGELLSSRIVAGRVEPPASRGLGRRPPAIVTDDEHTARGAAPRRDQARRRSRGRAAPRGRPSAGPWRLRRRHARQARRRRSAAADRTIRRRSSARAWAPTEIQILDRRRRHAHRRPARRARCRASCRTFRSPKRPSSRISAPRCCTRHDPAGGREQHPGPDPQQPTAGRDRAPSSRRGRRRDRPFAALACKRGITVVDITSTRMLMAHGFLRRLFEVFERYRTPWTS